MVQCQLDISSNGTIRHVSIPTTYRDLIDVISFQSGALSIHEYATAALLLNILPSDKSRIKYLPIFTSHRP